MGSDSTIRQLDDLVKCRLVDGERIVSTDISRLTAPGENYGSIMLRVLITIENTKTKQTRLLDTVAKTVPDSERIQEVFDTQVTYRNEYKFYAVICPTLDQFLKKNGVPSGADFLAPFINGRLNLDGSNKVDSDAVILMENLRTAGYSTGKKSIGLDMEHSKVVLTALAKFHAAGMGLKAKEPEVFEKNLRPYFYTFHPDAGLIFTMKLTFLHALKSNGFSENEIQKVVDAFDRDVEKTNVSDAWGTLIHYDSWTNNNLIKYDDGKPSHCVIVDFQVFDYATPLNDVTFFLFTSVQKEFFANNLDELFQYYYDRLIEELRLLGVDTTPHTPQSYQKEIATALKYYEYFHILWMSLPLMHEDFKSVEDIDKDEMDQVLELSENHVNKIVQITRLCLDRNWI